MEVARDIIEFARVLLSLKSKERGERPWGGREGCQQEQGSRKRGHGRGDHQADQREGAASRGRDHQ